ncbi:hypothetical protein [Reyranella soli]|nr:hypothetical protein [Reyranella soli]
MTDDLDEKSINLVEATWLGSAASARSCMAATTTRITGHETR